MSEDIAPQISKSDHRKNRLNTSYGKDLGKAKPAQSPRADTWEGADSLVVSPAAVCRPGLSGLPVRLVTRSRDQENLTYTVYLDSSL